MTDVIRAWKDEEYRCGLSAAERTDLPAHPAGEVQLGDDAMGEARGGEAMNTEHLLTMGCCGGFTTDPHACTFLCDTAPSTWTNRCMTSGVI